VPTQEHHSFAEHEAILDAIERRDGDAAQARMKLHLQAVRNDMFPED
jgi:DNA-binding GntR family transcriptional regulator